MRAAALLIVLSAVLPASTAAQVPAPAKPAPGKPAPAKPAPGKPPVKAAPPKPIAQSQRCTFQIDNVDRQGAVNETPTGTNYFAGGNVQLRCRGMQIPCEATA